MIITNKQLLLQIIFFNKTYIFIQSIYTRIIFQFLKNKSILLKIFRLLLRNSYFVSDTLELGSYFTYFIITSVPLLQIFHLMKKTQLTIEGTSPLFNRF